MLEAVKFTKGPLKMLRYFKLFHLKLVRKKDSRHSLATAVALGLFIGFVIPVGPQMILCIIFGTLLKCNRPIACAATFVSNPWDAPILYPFQIWLGSLISGIEISDTLAKDFVRVMGEVDFWSWHWEPLTTFFKTNSTSIVANFFIGGLMLATVSIAICYPLTLRAIDRHQVHKKVRIRKRRAKRLNQLQQMLEDGRITQEYYDRESPKFMPPEEGSKP